MLPLAFPRGLRRTLTLVLSTVTLSAAAVAFGSTRLEQAEASSQRSEQLTILHAQFRSSSEFGVVIFQSLSVTGFCVGHFVPNRFWNHLGRSLFVASMTGLGLCGISCSVYSSDFALFSGLTMAVLFIFSVLDTGSAHGARSAATKQL